MSITLKTHKMLWGRSGNMCAFPDCKKTLVVDETETDDASVIGEEAHIVAKKESGPRGQCELIQEQRDKYDNLILLCSIHHKTIDDQPNEYIVEKLKVFKQKHELWVKENLITDSKKMREDEIYAGYVEKFIALTDLHNWYNWTSWILGSSEIFPKDIFKSLQKVPDYVVSRIWPQRYPELESAFINFKTVLNDLLSVYYKYPDERRNGYAIEKFYKQYNYQRCMMNGQEYSSEDERLALEMYKYHVALIEDLVLELTRAANYICDYIRNNIYKGFRIEEGALLVTRGDILGQETFRVEYRTEERTKHPYPGLKEFMTIRKHRDLHIGEGVENEYFSKMPFVE